MKHKSCSNISIISLNWNDKVTGTCGLNSSWRRTMGEAYLSCILHNQYCGSGRTVIWVCKTSMHAYQRIEAEIKWPPFSRRHFQMHFLEWKVWISIKISVKFVPEVRINNIPALVQIMAWHRTGDKPLSEPRMVILWTQICVTRPQCWDSVSTWIETRHPPSNFKSTCGKKGIHP